MNNTQLIALMAAILRAAPGKEPGSARYSVQDATDEAAKILFYTGKVSLVAPAPLSLVTPREVK